MQFNEILPIITVVSAVILVVAILLQQRGATLGAGFGASGELYTPRRGFDKNLFDVTVVMAVFFVGSILVALVMGS